jgi:hypothetical protein
MSRDLSDAMTGLGIGAKGTGADATQREMHGTRVVPFIPTRAGSLLSRPKLRIHQAEQPKHLPQRIIRDLLFPLLIIAIHHRDFALTNVRKLRIGGQLG